MPKAEINGVKLHYEVSGIGPSLMLCHGYSGSHQDWLYQIPLLSEGYQVVTVDLRGHGSSEAPSQAEAYSVPIFARDMYQLLVRLGISRCCLVGHSLGGFASLHLALEQPQLVSALVLVDSSSAPVEIPGFAEVRARLDEIARKEGLEAAFEYSAQHNPLMQKRFEKYPRLREVSKRKICSTSVDGYVYGWRAVSQWPGVTARLGEISAPTLVMVGEEDLPFHKPSSVLIKSMPNARLRVVPGATHYPHEENPRAFNEFLMEFLREIVLK